MNKKKLKTFFHYHWQYYLLIVGVVSLFYYSVYEICKTPSYDETICLFIESKRVQTTTLQERLNQDLQDTKICKIQIDYADGDDSYYSMIFSTRGLVNTDLLLIADDYLPKGTYKNYFIPFNFTILENYFHCLEHTYFVDEDGQTYGIFVNNIQQDVIEYKENKQYYLFLNKKSQKLGDLSVHSKDDSALRVITNFLKEP